GMPGRHGAEPVAPGINVEQVGPAFLRRRLRPFDRALERVRLLDGLRLHPERHRGLGVIDVRAAVIAGHVAAGPELLAGEVPYAVALVVVALVVQHDVHHRRAVARLAPQGLRPGEAEAAIADDRDHWLVRPRKLDAEPCRHTPAEHVRAGAEIRLALAAERHRGLHGAAGIDIADETRIGRERGFELEPHAFEAHRRAARILVDDLH